MTASTPKRPKNLDDASQEFQNAIVDLASAAGRGNYEEDVKRFIAAGTNLNSLVGNLSKKYKPANDNVRPYPGAQSSGDFVRDFLVPPYIVDGIVQMRFIYSLTGMTHAGKSAVLLLLAYCIATGTSFAGRNVRQGKVMYLAGENPDDIKMRWIAMAEHLGFDPDLIQVHFVPGTYSIPDAMSGIESDANAIGGVDLVVIDTSAAFFQGDDENSNALAGKHARELRELCALPGGPCVIIATHPVKNPDMANLLPRGGGAFVNEVDGNLTLIKRGETSILHWAGKHRGVKFDPLHFEMDIVQADALVTEDGDSIPTVIARPLGDDDVKTRRREADRDEDDVLIQISHLVRPSLSDIAGALGWTDAKGDPDKERTRRAVDRLAAPRRKMVEKPIRRGGAYKVLKAGEDALVDIRAERHSEETARRIISNLSDAA